jgi:hypothetical protein
VSARSGRLEFLIAPSLVVVSRCPSLWYISRIPGRFWVDLLARAGWMKRERTNFMGRITILFLRRLWLPTLVFGAFCLICVAVYTRLEGFRAIDAFFWIFIRIRSITVLSALRQSYFRFSYAWECLPFRCGSRNGYWSRSLTGKVWRLGNP